LYVFVHTQAAEDVSQEKRRGEIEAEEDPISPISGKFTAGDRNLFHG
jgi:hypothetical protein